MTKRGPVTNTKRLLIEICIVCGITLVFSTTVISIFAALPGEVDIDNENTLTFDDGSIANTPRAVVDHNECEKWWFTADVNGICPAIDCNEGVLEITGDANVVISGMYRFFVGNGWSHTKPVIFKGVRK